MFQIIKFLHHKLPNNTSKLANKVFKNEYDILMKFLLKTVEIYAQR